MKTNLEKVFPKGMGKKGLIKIWVVKFMKTLF